MKKRREDKAERAAERITRRFRMGGGPSSNDAPLHASIMNGLVSSNADLQRPKLADVARTPAPGAPPVPRAQWNEVTSHWERWDDASGTWVAVPVEP